MSASHAEFEVDLIYWADDGPCVHISCECGTTLITEIRWQSVTSSEIRAALAAHKIQAERDAIKMGDPR